MINKPPPFKGLNIRIPIIIPIGGRGFINQGSWLLRTDPITQIKSPPSPSPLSRVMVITLCIVTVISLGPPVNPK